MVSRGSSLHHNRRTANPFMTTSSGIVGINLNEKMAFEAPRFETSNQQQHSNTSTNSLTAFMYQTTSQALGEGIRSERSKLSQRMDKATLHKEVENSGLVQLKPVDVIAPQDCLYSPEDVLPPNLDIRSISEARKEHPVYATSTREIGADKAAAFKIEAERLGRPNTFTNSFNGFRYRDFGLNTAITKSRISDQLD